MSLSNVENLDLYAIISGRDPHALCFVVVVALRTSHTHTGTHRRKRNIKNKFKKQSLGHTFLAVVMMGL